MINAAIQPTQWATEPPAGTSLTPAEQKIRDELEERRRTGAERVSPIAERVRAEQVARDAAIAERFGLSPAQLIEFAEEHAATLAPRRADVAGAQRALDRALEGERRAIALAAEKAADLQRFTDLEQEAAERFAADCEASLVSGGVPNPYAAEWSAEDAAAERRAQLEHRGAQAAVERLGATVKQAREQLQAAQHALQRAVDELLLERCGKPLVESFQAALNTAESLRVQVAAFRAIDRFGFLGMGGINRSVEVPVAGSTLPSSVEAGVWSDTASVRGARLAWLQKREALINGAQPVDAGQETTPNAEVAA
jgi:hypothetical protein